MAAIEVWLARATKRLSIDSADQVRREIADHFESAREVSIQNGASPEAADRAALASLGDPKKANREYRRALVTAAEARILNQVNWEAQAVRRRTSRWVLRALPALALCAAWFAFSEGRPMTGRGMLAVAVVIVFVAAAPTFPIYTPSRARAYRRVKWLGFLVAIALIVIPPTRILLVTCLAYQVYREWMRTSLRRKLAVGDWPKQLYL